MKKHLIVIGMTLVLLTVVFSGCEETDNPSGSEKDRFVGTWYLTTGGTLILFSDGTYTAISDDGGGSISGEWELKDNKLVLTTTSEEKTETSVSNYSFSDDDKTIHITDVATGTTSVLKRQKNRVKTMTSMNNQLHQLHL